MRISARAEYACLAVIALARRFHEDRPLPIHEIADAQGIPAKFLTHILLRLKRAGLVTSTRGSSGGYRLARAPEEISLMDVLKVVDGYGMTLAERSAPSGPALALAQVWNQIRASEAAVLSGTSIAKLLDQSDVQNWVI
ncbi:MAG: RrF2 family transcriptional regulator [Isosphaeraceae bacterium]